MFLNFGLNLCSIDILLGFDFIKWPSKHVVLWVSKCFPEKLAQKDEFWHVWLLVWALGANLKNPDFGFHARATTFVLRLSLERRNAGASVNCKLSGFCVCRRTLERRDLHSSKELCLTLERESSEHRAGIFKNQYFSIFTDRSSEGVYTRATPLFR